jgi:hypothetical protein
MMILARRPTKTPTWTTSASMMKRTMSIRMTMTRVVPKRMRKELQENRKRQQAMWKKKTGGCLQAVAEWSRRTVARIGRGVRRRQLRTSARDPAEVACMCGQPHSTPMRGECGRTAHRGGRRRRRRKRPVCDGEGLTGAV